MAYRPAFDYRIRERREALGLSQQQLGMRAGFHERSAQPRISGIERGHAGQADVRAALRGLAFVVADRLWARTDARRVAEQRRLFAEEATPRLRAAVLQRARDLVESAQPEAADALLEYLPIEDVERLAEGWD